MKRKNNIFISFIFVNRIYINIYCFHSKSEAQFISLAWAIESMKSHRCLKVHFSFEGRMLVDAINGLLNGLPSGLK